MGGVEVSVNMHPRVLIVGGGTGGITVAARLARSGRALDITVLEPSDRHYYQPLWTLVGGGAARKEDTVRAEADYIPAGVRWVRDRAREFRPEQKLVITAGGEALAYDALVVAPGIQIDWGKIDGLEGALGRDGVCSNYSYDHVDSTWEFIRGLRGGRAIFTMPNTPV
ncbi:MAG: NAD(P)/FAD-dependent oxidoreductase, partial [Myxococcales bacterium]|nr:NAD(P)/FAD-dependent oxidoreductase [Myxococcales bacterium]